MNGGQDNSLVKELQQAIKLMNAGKNAGAIGVLDSFISEVNDLLSSGVLSPSQAASLVSTAESVIAQLSWRDRSARMSARDETVAELVAVA